MGTRGAVGFRVNRQDKLQYNHFDSYPEGLGHEVLEFIKNETIDSLKEMANKIEMVDEYIAPSSEQIKECSKWSNCEIKEGEEIDWYSLLRSAQGNLSVYNNGLKYMLNANSFMLDSLFCEYAYVINIDNQKLEFYSGYNKIARKGKGRYADKMQAGSTNNFHGVVLIKNYDLNEIIGANNEKIESIISDMQKKSESYYERQEKLMNEID